MFKKKRFNVLVSCIIALSFMLVPGFAFASADGLGPVTDNAVMVTVNAAPVIVNGYPIVEHRMWVSENGVRVRSQPNTSSTVLGLLYSNNGDYVDVTQGDVMVNGYYTWLYGRTSTGIYGWVYADYLLGG